MGRFCHLARLARREMMKARDHGDFAKVFLKKNRAKEARQAAWSAFCHWRNARRALKRLEPCANVFSERALSLSA